MELRLKDKSRIDPKNVLTSDEALYEISNMKKELTTKLLKAVKESAVDCVIHSGKDDSEPLQCFTFGQVNSNNFVYKNVQAEPTNHILMKYLYHHL